MKDKQLYIIWFIALLPLMILRDYTPNNELRYLSIVDEALKNGNFFTFTNQGEIYADKPPLYFWLMMAGKTLLGGHRMWFLSLLSFIPALVVMMTMAKWLRKEESRNQPEALLMLMTGGLFAGLAIIIRMDMLMVMFITLSLYTFFKIYQGQAKKGDYYLFPLYLFLALFSKGPVGILVPLLSTLLFLLHRGEIHTWERYWGWKSMLVLLTGCSIWFAGVYLEGGNSYLNNLLIHQTVGRGINSFHHKEPFYYYFITIWYSLAPWMFFSIGLIIAGMIRKKIQTDTERFFLTIIISTFIMLSIISSKLAVYMLPALPFFIGLSAILIDKFNEKNIWLRLSLALPALILASALPLIIYIAKTDTPFFAAVPLVFAAATVATLSGIAVLYLLFLKKELRLSIRVMSLGLLLAIFIAGWAMPQLNPYMGWSKLCQEASRLAEERQASEYCVYNISRAESMDVFLKKDVIYVSEEDILSNSLTGNLLLLPEKTINKNKKIQSVIAEKEGYKVGPYMIVIF
ncbi:ArnT family glycosyltransferase [Proteiniphilum sp. UBA5375]|uniref:ArnT family glycosyltransferase n=1 Tax=Proteiniphilum sp. UBA5375 TaxID=1947278 RepID=UPI00257A413D|nr:dolichyl-phosphate-mannose--protein mannosyltransferase [Proteiniphilum sp. UBA5375]